jgi:hypothetical protein
MFEREENVPLSFCPPPTDFQTKGYRSHLHLIKYGPLAI